MMISRPKRIRLFVVSAAVSLAFAGCLYFRPDQPAEAPAADPEAVLYTVAQHPGQRLGFPSPQTALHETNNPAVFMPTASGRVESAGYGSVRTRKFGKLYLPAFHEGIDIAPTERDSKRRPTDPVFAVADGRIGYISRTAGNSSYGIYVVLLHEDRLGEYHTLYAHLASVPDALKSGDAVARGAQIGQIGHTSTLGIPVERSHLHFEFGTMLNSRFDRWLRSQKMTLTHGRHHGYNLAGLNPEALVSYMTNGEHFVFQQYITNVPVAFRMLVPTDVKPDYYGRYPALWVGDEPDGAIVLDVSEGGVPLQARAATPEEIALLKSKKPQVLEAFPDVLGRNGKRLVVESGGRWIPGRNAAQWLDILLYR